MNPLISIIIPNYNHALFLEKRLESVYNQSYLHFEVILLDDASTDNSIEILTAYKNHPKTAQLLVNSQNSGSPFKQWQKGVELAKGELIWIAESDDYAAPNFLEQVAQPLLTNKEIGLAYCQSVVVDENSQELYINTQWTDDLDKNRWLTNYTNNGLHECKNYLFYKCTIPNASAVVFRKNLATAFPVTFKMAGDWWFWMNLLPNTNITYIKDSLNYFRAHANTTRISGDLTKKKLRLIEEVKVASLIKSQVDSPVYLKKIEKVYANYLRILPLKMLLFNSIKPYQFTDNSLNYSKIVLLFIKELCYRFNRKINNV